MLILFCTHVAHHSRMLYGLCCSCHENFGMYVGKKLIISSIGLYVLESEATTPDAGSVKPLNNEPIKPHEQRALNFLVNEYLLLHGYKLTSITFADENENQVCYH